MLEKLEIMYILTIRFYFTNHSSHKGNAEKDVV
jgi:hypothetical protein